MVFCKNDKQKSNKVHNSLTILQRLRVSVQPTDEWKPAIRPPPGDVEMSKTLIFNGMTL